MNKIKIGDVLKHKEEIGYACDGYLLTEIYVGKRTKNKLLHLSYCEPQTGMPMTHIVEDCGQFVICEKNKGEK